MNFKRVIAAICLAAFFFTALPCVATTDDGAYSITDEFKTMDYTYKVNAFASFNTSDAKYGDTSRAIKTDVWDSHIVYRFKGLESFELTTYETNSTRLTSNILDVIVDIYLSEDGTEWVSADVEENFASDEQWRKYVYVCKNIDESVKYLKIVVKRLGAGYQSQHEAQLGRIKFNFAKGGKLLPKASNVEIVDDNGLSAVFGDDFNAGLGNWNIDESFADLVKSVKVDGDGVAALESCMDGKTARSPFIETTGLALNDQFYKISAKIKLENHSGDKCISILSLRDGQPVYSYPISINKEGCLGYRNADYQHVSIEPACYVSTDEWHTVSAVIDTKNALAVYYLDGVRVSEQTAELGTPSDGGISQIKIAALESDNVSGTMSVSSILVEDAQGLFSAIGTTATELSKNGVNHWSKPYTDFLIAQGVSSVKGVNPESYITAEEFYSWIKLCSEGDNISAVGKNPITRAEAVSAAMDNIVKSDEDFETYANVFDDLSGLDQKTKNNIISAYGEGIISGQNGKFTPKNSITYAEAASIVAKACSPRMRVSAGYNVAVYSDKSFVNYAETLIKKLKQNGMHARIFDAVDMQDYDVLNDSVIDCLVLLNAVEDSFIPTIRAYVENGGDLVVGGSGMFDRLNNHEFRLPFYNANDDPNYAYDTGVLLKTAEGQEDFTKNFKLKGIFSGVDAVGYEDRVYSKYIPFLEIQNKYGDRIGYGAGVLVNIGGLYPYSNWLGYGINEPEFYGTDVFRDGTAYILNEFKSGRLDKKYEDTMFIQNNKDAVANFVMTEPRPAGYVHLSEDGTQLIDADGNEMFVVGANVQGLQSMYDTSDSGAMRPEFWENIFKVAHDAGVNVIRLWLDYRTIDENIAKMVINAARKYRVYFFLEGSMSASEAVSLDRIEAYCKAFGDEPMFLGIDYGNEPHKVLFLASMGGTEEENPIMEYNLLESDFIKSNPALINYFKTAWGNNISSFVNNGTFSISFRDSLAAAEMVAYYQLLEGSDGFDMKDAKFREDAEPWMYEMFERLFAQGFERRNSLVKKYSSHAMVTIGHLNRQAMLPGVADGQDFWSYHAYVKPDSYERVLDEMALYGKLKDIKDMPTVLGEFGLCATDKLADGSIVREDTSNAYNFLHWAYAFANGYSGAVLWTLTERHPANYRYLFSGNQPRSSWEKGSTYFERWGAFSYDGNPDTGYKPKFTAKATKFFETYRLSHNIGDGEIDIFPDDTQMKAGYNFVGDTAQYVCARSFESDRISFDIGEDQSPLVLLDWSDGKITLLASHEMDIVIDPSKYVSGITADSCVVSGSGDLVSRSSNTIKIRTSKGNKVYISAK